jgi:NAD(P)-dependent dehydrogenase (short-subunit alcohol dehydrogenase family)
MYCKTLNLNGWNMESKSKGSRLYRQITSKLLEMMESGEYPPGSRLPAERELSELFGVSRPTIREAVIALESQGRVNVKTGSGVYVGEPQVDITSLGSLLGFPDNPSYISSKGGLKMLTKSLAVDFGKKGVRVNNILPGYMKTSMTKGSYSNKELKHQFFERRNKDS